MSLDYDLLFPTAIALVSLILAILTGLRFRLVQLECRDPLFSPEFRVFLGQLDIAVRSHLIVFPAMPVKDVLIGNRAGKVLLRRTGHDRFDFVVCHRRDMEVLCVIKLGGSDSENEKLRKLCEIVGLTLLEYDIKPYRDVPGLRKDVFGACGIDEFELPHNGINTPFESVAPEPDCPKCGSDMQLHVIRKGDYAGEKCWVCSQYPDCKGARFKDKVSD